MAKVEITPELILEAMQSDKVRAALRARADKIAARAVAIAEAEEVDPTGIKVQEGTRPKGRPYARVESEASQEYGDSRTPRIRLLGRVSGSS